MCLRLKPDEWTTMAAALLLVLTGTVAAQERPLPEVARQKPGKTASRVYTNEDLEKARPLEASLPSSATRSEPKAAPQGREAARITVPGLLQEASATQARTILNSLRHDEEVLLRRYAEIQRKLAGETDEHLRELYSNSLARRDETLARKRQQIADVKKAIEAAEHNPAASPENKHEKETGVRK